jgi:glycyl-tRNA synthetase beta chain
MGGYYARAEGLPDAVAGAIRDHYKPVGQGDEVPTAPVTVAVSLADKLDNLITFFSEEMRPTGSKDPYALRRSALGAISLILVNQLRFPLRHTLIEDALGWKNSIQTFRLPNAKRSSRGFESSGVRLRWTTTLSSSNSSPTASRSSSARPASATT